jgi:hypothetical protein
VERLVDPGLRAVVERAFVLEAGPSGGAGRLLIALLDDHGAAGAALADAGVGHDVVANDPAARTGRFAAELLQVTYTAWRLATQLGGTDAKATPAHLLVVVLSEHPWSLAAAVPDAAALRARVLAGL